MGLLLLALIACTPLQVEPGNPTRHVHRISRTSPPHVNPQLTSSPQSCITEAQKYEGSLHKQDKHNHPRQHHAQSHARDILPDTRIARVEVPPPAPSPPPSGDPPVNVYDYLVKERYSESSPSDSGSPAAHPPPTKVARRNPGYATVERLPPEARRPKPDIPDDAVSYGQGPIKKSLRKYDSELDRFMQGHKTSSAMPPPDRTPGPPRLMQDESSRSSEKKRKRDQNDELDTIDQRSSTRGGSDGGRVLHSGLTGGLGKMLGRDESHQVEPSPLGPKKRSKYVGEEGSFSVPEDERPHNHRRGDATEVPRNVRESRQHHHQSHDLKALEGRNDLKAIEYSRSESAVPKSRLSIESHSGYFLSLIDKDHSSKKGQSIWGTMKMFHEGLEQGLEDDVTVDADDRRQREEKRLFKGLRMKVNRQGEIVLFSRSDRERSLSPDRPSTSRRPKRIEALR